MKNRAEFWEHNAVFQQFTIYPLNKWYESMTPLIRGGVKSMIPPIKGVWILTFPIGGV